MPETIFEIESRDVWFQSATDSIYALAEDREHPKHGRNNTHPFFSIIYHPIIFILKKGMAIHLITAMKLVTTGIAFIWGFSLFLLLRKIECPKLDATAFTLLAATSSAALFWFAVPETFSFGSLSILIALIILLLSQHDKLSSLWYYVINFLTFSFATTNWMAGILITMANHRFKEAIQLLSNFFCLATILWGIQKLIYPTSRFFLDVSGETDFVNRPEAGGPLHVIKSFIYHTLVTPTITLINNPNDSPQWPSIMSVQLSNPGSANTWGMCAVILWTILLIIGVWALFSLTHHIKFRIVLTFLLLGQLILHSVYGEETFLYSLHFIILLIILAALGSLTRARKFVIFLTILLIPCVFINNTLQFNNAISIFQRLGIDAKATTIINIER